MRILFRRNIVLSCHLNWDVHELFISLNHSVATPITVQCSKQALCCIMYMYMYKDKLYFVCCCRNYIDGG